VTAIKGVG